MNIREAILKNRKHDISLVKDEADLRPLSGLICGREVIAELSEAVMSGRYVTVYGDYDADGIMAAYILCASLSLLNPGKAGWFINDRFEDGYNMTTASVEKCLAEHPDTELMITCDNGINAAEAVAFAMAKGVDVIVTDHHVQTRPLPAGCRALDERSLEQVKADEAFGILPEGFCGAELARRVVRELFATLGKDKEFREYLDGLYAYSAFATIADHVPMNAANHYVGRRGLDIIAEGEGFWGVLKDEYLAERGLRQLRIDSSAIGFSYAPMINASSRMTGSADTAMRALMSANGAPGDDAKQAIRALIGLNEERKEVCARDDMVAFDIIEKNGYDRDPFILVCDPRLSEGVNGLTATHITEKYKVPSAVLSPNRNDASVFKGSARSPEGFDLVRALTSHGELIRAGGHPLAAGLSVSETDIETVRALLNRDAVGFRYEPVKKFDLVFSPEDLSVRLVNEIAEITRSLEPFGPGFEEPRILVVGRARDIWESAKKGTGKKVHAKFPLGRAADGSFVDAVWWNHLDDAKAVFEPGKELGFKGGLGLNEFRGKVSLQITVTGILSGNDLRSL